MAEFLLALDLGTTSVRALMIGPDGRCCSRAQRPISAAFPSPGRVEQDPEELWDESLLVLREALRLAKLDPAAVAAIGIVSQRATALAWDSRNLRPLAPAIGWQDQRTAERVAEFRAAGIPISTLPTATKFEWWLGNDESVRSAAEQGFLRLGNPDAWLSAKLSGGAAHVTDPGHASCTALYDTAAGEWSAPLCELFGVPLEALPEIAPSSGIVAESDARLFGGAIPLAARAGDQQASAFAQGVHQPGDAKLTLGTSGMLDLHTGTSPVAPPPGTYPLALWRLADGCSAFCLEGTVITAGAALDWLVDLGVCEGAAAAVRLAGEVDSTDGVVFVPALQGLGTPSLDDQARGMVLGLTRGTSAAHLARAVLEGVAQRCVDVVHGVGLNEAPLRVDGGLARSELLLQLIADLSGREILQTSETETTAFGAAFLAGLASGVFPDAASCMATLDPPTRVAPSLDADRRAELRGRWAEALDRVQAHAHA